jgi:beta-glucosidase
MGKERKLHRASLKLTATALGMLAAALTICATPRYAAAQNAPAVVTGNARVDKLLSQLTLDEKIALIHGAAEDAGTYQGQAGYMAGIPRLGIPALRLADGPPGVLTRIPASAPTATMGLAATFSRTDARANGKLIAAQARARGIDVVLQPFINIDRDFAYGRGYNTYGEDPVLTGQIGAEFIRGVQGEGILSQAKHYVGYDTDGGDVVVDQQALHEVYVAPFADAVAAGVSSIMCSYNKINGHSACGNNDTLNKILKDEIGFKGFVTSDWGATHATDFINAGLDMEMPGPLAVSWNGPSYFVNNPKREAEPAGPQEGPALTDAGLPEEPRGKGWEGGPPEPAPTTNLKNLLAAGTITEDTITRAAGRVLFQMEKFGLLDGKAKPEIAATDNPEEAKVIEKTANDAAVLLKNADAILPLKAADLDNLVLIGPGAAQLVAVGAIGEKAVGLPEREVGPLAALKKLAGDAAHVSYAAANDMTGTPVPAQYFTHFGEAGLERRVFKEDAVHIDPDLNFTHAGGTALKPDQSIVWTGTLNVPESGSYRLHLQLLGCYGKLKIDDQVVAKNWYNFIHGELIQAGQDNIFPTPDGLDNLRAAMQLSAGPHRIRVEVDPDSSHHPVQVRFNWVTPQQQTENYQAAIEAARHAKTAVVFAWSRTHPVFALPGDKDKLISDIAAVNPNTVVVLNVSQPVALPWLDKVKAVVQMWWPGDEGGWATANVLLGRANPAGRLPFTWPVRAQDMPAADPAHPERSNQGVNGKTTFSEGIYVGYRWFDQQKTDPLFAFGYGLSYTHFDYSGLKVEHAQDGGLDVNFSVKNSGAVAGDEVPQAYLDAPQKAPEGAQFAVRALAGFDRIHLQAGETQAVKLHIPRRSLQYWSIAQNQWVAALGARRLEVGASARDLRLGTKVVIPQ